MEQNSTDLLTEEKSGFKLRDFIPIRFVYSIIFIIIATAIVFSSQFFYESKINKYKKDIYTSISKELLVYLKTTIDLKVNSSFVLANSLANHADIKRALTKNDATLLNIDEILVDIKTKKEYVNLKVEILNTKGEVFKGNLHNSTNQNLTTTKLLKQNTTIFDANMFGYFIKHTIPIFEQGTLLGYFCLYLDFDQIAQLTQKHNINTLMLLNEEDSKKVYQNRSHSKSFIDNIYVINANANKYLERLIRQYGVKDFMNKWDYEYMIDEDEENLIIRYDMKTENKLNASIFLFKPMTQIDFKDISIIKSWYIAVSVLIVLFVGFFIYFSYSLVRIKELSMENSSLIIVNEDLKTKTDELDFNDKKLENLFNMQPNLMMMHNGKEITKGNKRFMGFFRRFGSFDGFRKEHKCVSELFEKFDGPNYICEQYIEDEFWVDYILDNPKRLYKAVMSVDGDPHHFIIKVNEMNYAKYVSERLIVIALVDVTQDLKNYKPIKEQNNA